MKFLFLSQYEDRFLNLKKLINRESVLLVHSITQEHAFFQVLHDPVDALIIDLTDPQLRLNDIMSTVESLDQDLEVMLIGSTEQLNHQPVELLMRCCGFMLPCLEDPLNRMLFVQLQQKIEAKITIKNLQNSSVMDGLTGLYNHAYIQRYLEEEIQLMRQSKEPLTLVFFDIDNFKNYNDTNGHPAGDRVLQRISGLMRDCFRRFDFMGRYGGEEFVVVFPGTSLARALQITERFRNKIITTEFEFGSLQPLGFVSASFGVCAIDHKEVRDKKTLLDLADQALYRAKDNKKNCIWFYHRGAFHIF